MDQCKSIGLIFLSCVAKPKLIFFTPMKIFKSFSRIVVGVVFIFSGFVKALDPLGSTYKFTDYFNAFGLDFIIGLAFPLALMLSAVELLIGISLLLGYRMKIVSWTVLLFMSFFTILTFILALYNPVTDCGCFGDALILTNWQTFWKNLVLMVFTLTVFFERNTFVPVRGAFAEWGILSFFFAMVLGLSFYCFNHLPILDFRPYKVGTHIPSASAIPPGAPSDVYETRLFYRNTVDGITSEFTIENFPDDSVWEFVDSKSVLISKGYEPPIHDFSISAPNKEDLTETIKNSTGFVFLLVSYNLPKADPTSLKKANDFFKLSASFSDVQFFAVTASLEDDIEQLRDTLGLMYDFGSADEIALKTIIRSNPGLVLIKNGTILGKWHFNDFPEVSSLNSNYGKLINNFPMAAGVDLRSLRTPPAGSRNDLFHTSLVYRNILNDSIANFSMDNYPQSPDWEFVSSHSEKTKSGFKSPLEDFKMISPDGIDISESILQQNSDVFLIVSKDPQSLDPDMLDRLNKLSIAGASIQEEPAAFYGITTLSSSEIYEFTNAFITPIAFCSSPSGFVESVSGDGVSLIHIKNGKVKGRWDNALIPGPEEIQSIVSREENIKDFEGSMISYLITKYRTSIETTRVYSLLLFFLFLALFIRVFLEDPFRKEN